MTIFDKPAHSLDQQLELLRQRELLIPDENRARHYLNNISYYRLSAYTRPFYIPQEQSHRFRHGTEFDHVLNLYIFDRELRLHLLNAIERIEVALRAQMTNILAEHYGAHGYTNADIFDDRYNHISINATKNTKKMGFYSKRRHSQSSRSTITYTASAPLLYAMGSHRKLYACCIPK